MVRNDELGYLNKFTLYTQIQDFYLPLIKLILLDSVYYSILSKFFRDTDLIQSIFIPAPFLQLQVL